MRKGNIFDPRNLCNGTHTFSKSINMNIKNSARLSVLVGMLSFAFFSDAVAQDDLYYNPYTDGYTAPANTNHYPEDNNLTQVDDGNDEYYEEDEEYAYEYSSRIRRFHRPAQVVDYYDPFFVDMYYYDPFFSPGVSIYVHNYNDYWSYRRWNRWNRWNRWDSYNSGYGMGWNSWGWNSAYAGYSPWYNPWVVNNYYYDPYWTCNGYNPYYDNSWSNNHHHYNGGNGGNGGNGNNGGYAPKTYTGTRRHGSSVNPGYARIEDT
ncbi:MAG: hypothetical protein RIQ78_1167, partial [Bacteroidota bacterium]